jgi:hypothetical protein
LISIIAIGLLLLGTVMPASGQPVLADRPGSPINLSACQEFAYSTEEDFLSQGPTPPDGNPLISDGDLLSRNGVVCMRNRDLLRAWEVTADLGLDAVDIIDVERRLVAFSTELDDPGGRFKAGDLLTTNGAVIPNAALLTLFQVGRDLGLDGLQLIGSDDKLIAFFLEAAQHDRSFWLGGTLSQYLRRYGVDIWFSTEGTERTAAVTQILDGDLLSARDGIIVVSQAVLLPAAVPAGIPNRGVDFGLDAVATTRQGDRGLLRFSTEILYRKEPTFNDGDILRLGNGVEINHEDLVAPFEPKARFLGVDALYIRQPSPPLDFHIFFPWILKLFRLVAGGPQ